jgi:hypothetical protein
MTVRATPSRKKLRVKLWHPEIPDCEELLAYCPRCKALEVLRFTPEGLVPTSKFIQRENQVYHNCNAAIPCRLHKLSIHKAMIPNPNSFRIKSTLTIIHPTEPPDNE